MLPEFSQKPRVVFDTNVVVSWFVRPQSMPGQAIRLAQAKATLLISQDIIDELGVVLNRPKFMRYVRAESVAQFIQAFVAITDIVPVATTLAVCRDPADDKFLALAVTAKADFIVTGDEDLLMLNPFHGVAIVTPTRFVERVANT